MSKFLQDALGNGAWSVSGVVFDLNDILDDEGRPISERRADSVARAGVEMEMRVCPYAGIRHGHLMNVSALAQISRYFTQSTADMSAFRREAGSPPSWNDMMACIVDLLSQPAIHLLKQHSEAGPVPARAAVNHKLAAGFFGVLRSVHERIALGADIPVTTDSLLHVVDEMGALLGASEACAGSPQMIRRACSALMDGTPDQSVKIDPSRLEIARCLSRQIQLGIFWHLYDTVHQWELLQGAFGQYLAPSNPFLKNKLASALSGLSGNTPPRPECSRLPETLEPYTRKAISEALCDTLTASDLAQDVHDATALLNDPGSAIGYSGDVPQLALQVARYLHAYRLVTAELSRLELVLRKLLGYPSEQPIRHGAAAFPIPQALTWYELIVGRHIGNDGHLTGSTTGARSNPVPLS